MKQVKFVPFHKPKYSAPKARTHACESCRKKKIKCDSTKPVCNMCTKRRITCVYKDPPPAVGTGKPAVTVAILPDVGDELASSNIAITTALTATDPLIPLAETEPDKTAHRPESPTPDEAVAIAPTEPPVVGKCLEPWSIQSRTTNKVPLRSAQPQPPPPSATLPPTPQQRQPFRLPTGPPPASTRPPPLMVAPAFGWTPSPLASPAHVTTFGHSRAPPTPLPSLAYHHHHHSSPPPHRPISSPCDPYTLLPYPSPQSAQLPGMRPPATPAGSYPHRLARRSSNKRSMNPLRTHDNEFDPIPNRPYPTAVQTPPPPTSSASSSSASATSASPSSATLSARFRPDGTHSWPTSPVVFEFPSSSPAPPDTTPRPPPLSALASAAAAPTGTTLPFLPPFDSTLPSNPASTGPALAPLQHIPRGLRGRHLRDRRIGSGSGPHHLMRDVLKTKSLSLSSLAPLATAVAPTSLSPTLPHHASADAPRSPSQATTLSSCAASDIDHQLITDYFEFLAPQIPVLHRPTFHQQILQRTIPQFLLDTVYALAARISRRPSAILGGRFEVSEKYATRARRALPTGEAANTLLGLQATVLLCLYELAVGHSDAGLNLCDEAWRIFHKLWTSQPALTGITTAGSLARGSRLDEIRRWLYDETLSRIMWTLISIRAGAARSRSIPCTVADIDQLPVSFPCDDWLWQRDALALGTDLGSCPPHLLMSLPVSGSALQALCTAASDAPDQLDYMPRPLVAHLNHRTNPFVKESPHLTRRGGLPYGDGHTKTWWEDLRSPTTMFNQLSFHSPASAQFPPDVIPPPPVSDSDPISGTTTSTNRAGLRLDTLTAILTLTVLANRSVRVRQVWHVNAGDPQAVIVSYRQVSAALRWWQQETNAELVDQTCYAAELAPQTTTTTTTLTSSSPLWSSLRQSAVLVPLLSKPEPEWAFHKSTEASLLSLGILYLSVQLELAYYAWSALRDLPAQSDGHHHQQQHKLPQPQHPVDLTMIPPQLVAADLWTECLHLVHECVALVQITHDVQLESLHGCVPQCVVSVVYIIRRLIEQRSALPKNIGNNNPMADDDTDASVERDALVTALSLLTDCLDQLYRYWHIPESETPPSPSPLTKCEK